MKTIYYYGQYALFDQQKYIGNILNNKSTFLVQIVKCDVLNPRKIQIHDVEEQVLVESKDHYCFKIIDAQLRKQWQQKPSNVAAPAGETGCIYAVYIEDVSLTWLPVYFKLDENSSFLFV